MASWELQDRLTPIQAGPMGNCSACCLRNLSKFCVKMRCDDPFTDNTVYWTTVNPGEHRECLMGVPPVGMAEWYNARTRQRVRDISTQVMQRLAENQN